jgi:large subunit ribosomal protein L24
MPKKARKSKNQYVAKLHMKKGDRVRVISGDYRGAEGVVRTVQRQRRRVTIEGVNMLMRHVRKSQKHPNGGIIEMEGPIHVSNVRVIEST